nr:dnaJ-like protein subfamily C member 22-like [Biomphalaria glabrata]
MASLSVTYILWLFFGWLGIHHLYLGRRNHAIVWFATLGGGFGIGWLRDLWRIPSYVEWATASGDFQRRYLLRMSLKKYPSCSIFRLFGFFFMGFLAALVFSGVIPNYSEDDWLSNPLYYLICRWCSKLLYVCGAILGVYLVANIGEIRCSLRQPFMGCLFSLPWVFIGDGNVTMAPLLAGLSTKFKGLQWQQLYKIYSHAGWKRMYSDAKHLFDLSGEGNAYRLLELSKSASQKEINKQCRLLSRQYHPDRQKDQEEKVKAQEKFIEIQKACNTLSTERSRRAKSSSRSEDKNTRMKSDPFRKRTDL